MLVMLSARTVKWNFTIPNDVDDKLGRLTSLTGSMSSRMGNPTAVQARQKGHGGSIRSVYALSVSGSLSCISIMIGPVLALYISASDQQDTSVSALATEGAWLHRRLSQQRSICCLERDGGDCTGSCCQAAPGMLPNAALSDMQYMGCACPDARSSPGRALL